MINHKSVLQTGTTRSREVSARIGVTSDEAENAPRLRVPYGEDSKESEPPLKRRVETHTARAQDSSAPVPWRWRSRGARIRGSHRPAQRTVGTRRTSTVRAEWPAGPPGDRSAEPAAVSPPLAPKRRDCLSRPMLSRTPRRCCPTAQHGPSPPASRATPWGHRRGCRTTGPMRSRGRVWGWRPCPAGANVPVAGEHAGGRPNRQPRRRPYSVRGRA